MIAIFKNRCKVTKKNPNPQIFLAKSCTIPQFYAVLCISIHFLPWNLYYKLLWNGSILHYPANFLCQILHYPANFPDVIRFRPLIRNFIRFLLISLHLNDYFVFLLQFYAELCKISAKTLIFIETMQINLHMSKYFCTFARRFGCISNSTEIYHRKIFKNFS